MSAGIYKLLYFRCNNLKRKLRAQIEYNLFFQKTVIFSKYITAKKKKTFSSHRTRKILCEVLLGVIYITITFLFSVCIGTFKCAIEDELISRLKME